MQKCFELFLAKMMPSLPIEHIFPRVAVSPCWLTHRSNLYRKIIFWGRQNHLTYLDLFKALKFGDSNLGRFASKEECYFQNGGCYLFDCGPSTPEEFKCRFTGNDAFTSGALLINRHAFEMSRCDLDKHYQFIVQALEL